MCLPCPSPCSATLASAITGFCTNLVPIGVSLGVFLLACLVWICCRSNKKKSAEDQGQANITAFNDEGRYTDLKNLVPLDAAELIATAKRATGFDDFGDERWREPFEILVKALEEEAELNYFGRLMARNDMLNWLKALLGINAAFKQHPEIADEVNVATQQAENDPYPAIEDRFNDVLAETYPLEK